jgi:hypothetical protein
VLVAALFIVWSAGFVLRSSVKLDDGTRVWCLFDDAMISMRYADNLTRGRGLVWNPGERVEGYSNPLMVAVMALFLVALPKPAAVLGVQVLGVALTLASGFIAVRLHGRVSGDDGRAPPWLALAAALSLYSVSYWAILGMETGLVTLLTGLAAWTVVEPGHGAPHARAARLGWLTAAMYLCRPDAALIGATLAVALVWQAGRATWRSAAACALPIGLVVVGHMLFRLAYYGSAVPNTATLKLTGVPLQIRLHDGATFVGPFLEGIIPMLVLAVYAIAHSPSRQKIALVAPLPVLLAYQVYVGGEPWAYWRILSPALPPIIALAVGGAVLAARRALPEPTPGRVVALALCALTVALAVHNRPLLREALLLGKCQEAVLNVGRVRAGLALGKLTGPRATVAVVGAGTIPFYSDRRGVDLLGKCDPSIARVAPDLSGVGSWYGMITMPGHNKYDLRRCIVEKKPTYVETPRWGRDDVSEWVSEHYAEVKFEGVSLLLLRGSPDVRWEMLGTARAARDPGRSAQRWEVVADLDGDGRFERATLDPARERSLAVEREGRVIASEAPSRWKPWRLDVADVDGDGRMEIAIGVHKPTRFIPRPHNCLFVYSFNGEAIVPLWLGSSLSRPFRDFAFGRPIGRGPWTLYAVEDAPGARFALAAYRWNGFGFTLERRTGAWRSLRLVGVTERAVEVEADGRRVALDRPVR